MSPKLVKLFKFLRKVKKSWSRYNPSVEVLISRKNLIGNLREYKKRFPKLAIAPVLKSNAYGHGLVQIASILDNENPAFFVVDSLYEAMILRNEKIKSRILVIGYSGSENINNCRLSDIAFTITSLEQLEQIAKSLRSRRDFHLKIDTGMHRQGILPSEINNAIEIIKNNELINLEGVCSHLASADNKNETFTKSQIGKWAKVASVFKQNFQDIKFFHALATAGIYYSGQTHDNAARLGIGLYGINTSPFLSLDLKPVLQMQSIVSSTKIIPAGEFIGYDNTYKTEKATKIATVPVGYFEGIDRGLSNRGFFKIGNSYCQIVGKVSMNTTSIDISSLPGVKLDDKVVIISNNSSDVNSIESIAKLVNATPYQVLVHIPQHLRRTIIKN